MAKQDEPINLSQEQFESIDRYLSGEMKVSEIVDFENQIKADSTLREKVDEFRILQKGIEIETLRSKVNDFHLELLDDTKSRTIFVNWSMAQFAAAASIIFLIALGGWWIFSSVNREERLFAEYFRPDPGLPTVMSAETDYNFDVAMVDYKRGEYAKAIEKWEVLLKKQPDNDTLNYFLGVANLANGNEKEAIALLEKISKLEESAFIMDAYYYLGLSYLKSGNREKAKELLEKSDTENGKKLLLDLNK